MKHSGGGIGSVGCQVSGCGEVCGGGTCFRGHTSLCCPWRWGSNGAFHYITSMAGAKDRSLCDVPMMHAVEKHDVCWDGLVGRQQRRVTKAVRIPVV